MQLNERVKKIRNWYNDTQPEMAKKIDRSETAVKNLENTKKVTNTRINTILNILKAYPEVNPTWLLTGNGEMLIDEKSSELLHEPQEKYEVKSEYNKHLKNEVEWLRNIIERNLKTDIDETEKPKKTKQTKYKQ